MKKYTIETSDQEEIKESPHKHKDALINLQFTLKKLDEYLFYKHSDPLQSFRVHVYDKDRDGLYSDPKAIIFKFNRGAGTCGMPISFHKEFGVFKRELEAFLSDCIRFKWIRPKNPDIF